MKGFTLIELIVVVLVASVLAMVAVPSYLSSVKKGNRRAAQAALMDGVQREQQYLADNRVYGDVTAIQFTAPTELSGLYTITFTPDNTQVPPVFTGKATPKAGGTMANDVTLTITNLGQKGPSGYW